MSNPDDESLTDALDAMLATQTLDEVLDQLTSDTDD